MVRTRRQEKEFVEVLGLGTNDLLGNKTSSTLASSTA